MGEQPAKNYPPWKRQWIKEPTWSAKELAKLCCGWDPDTGWDPDCGWEPANTVEALFDQADVVRWTFEDALARIRRAERVGDLHAVDLPKEATAEEFDCGDAPIFRSQEAAAWAAQRFPEFPYKEDDWLDASESTTAPADKEPRPTSDSMGAATSVVPAVPVARILDAKNKNDTEPTDQQRALVDAFIHRVFKETGRKIKRKDIWLAAGYTDATEFERFQRGKRTTGGSTAKFNRLLQLAPSEFLTRLPPNPAE